MEKLKSVLKNKKGIAGLDIALSVISMLFVIGLLVMIFALMGSEVQETTSIAEEMSASVDNETLTTVTETGEVLGAGIYPAGVCTISEVRKEDNYLVIAADNYTLSACTVAFAIGGNVSFNNTNWNVNYTVVYGGTSWQVINDTNTAFTEVPDWFPIVIVITFMVVLILLTVMIIRAIRGSGLMVGEGA